MSLQMPCGDQHEAGEGVGLVLQPVIVGFVHFPLELLPLVHGSELEFRVKFPVQIQVPELMRERETIAVQPSLKDELVDGDARQVAGNETIDLKKIAQSGQGYDVEAPFDFGNLFDRCRD